MVTGLKKRPVKEHLNKHLNKQEHTAYHVGSAHTQEQAHISIPSCSVEQVCIYFIKMFIYNRICKSLNTTKKNMIEILKNYIRSLNEA